ncbi:MAG: hypothetical protein ACRCTY_03925 [Candidatus Adiutrix sp.]
MIDKTEMKDIVLPELMTNLEWVWVFVSPITKHRDHIFVVEMEEADHTKRRVLPIFETRETADKLKEQLCAEKAATYDAHSMLLSEVGIFAAKNSLEIMLLDEAGHILAHMEARFEEHQVH